MAGKPGNVAYVAASKQTGKGVVPASLQYKNAFTGGSTLPEHPIARLSETDSSRDQGDAYVERVGSSGNPELYVRDSSIGFWLTAAFGTDTPSGAVNFTHVITPSNVLPYVSVWRGQSDLLWERHNDCLVNSITVRAEAGGPLTAVVNYLGRSSTRLTTDPASAVSFDSQAPYNFNEMTVTVGGGATSLVSSFEFTLENNVTQQQTDDIVPYDLVAGQRVVSVGFDMIFETLDEYNKFHYGGAAGTVQSGAIYTTSAVFECIRGVNNSVKFEVPVLAYEEFPVEPDPGGAPIVVSARGSANRNGANPIATATVKNQIATYPGV